MTNSALEVSGKAIGSESCRVAWLLPAAVLYWQPLLKEFTQRFSQTRVFTSHWRGFIQGFEDSFNVEIVGQRKFIEVASTSSHYDSGFMYLSPGIIGQLFRFKPQVVFTNSFGLWTILALLFKSIGRWQVVVAYEGSSPGVDYRNSPLRIGLRRLLVWLADALVTNSEAGKAYLTTVLKAEERRVFKHPYEVPDATALQGDLQDMESIVLQSQNPVFVYIGKVIPRKGLNFLLQACVKLEEQGCHKYTLLVIGDGPQRQELEAFCQEQNLQDRVQWVGRVPYEQLGAYVRAADVFVLPTLEDTWGMVVLEAMALGKPILCSRQAGAVELVTDGENGYRFDPDIPEDLANKMRRFIDQPDLIDSMGSKSKQLMTHYTPETAAQFLTEVASFVLRK